MLFSSFRNPAPCGVKARCHEGRTQRIGGGGGGETGGGEEKEGEETVNGKKAIIHFSLSFQALSHIKVSHR